MSLYKLHIGHTTKCRVVLKKTITLPTIGTNGKKISDANLFLIIVTDSDKRILTLVDFWNSTLGLPNIFSIDNHAYTRGGWFGSDNNYNDSSEFGVHFVAKTLNIECGEWITNVSIKGF